MKPPVLRYRPMQPTWRECEFPVWGTPNNGNSMYTRLGDRIFEVDQFGRIWELVPDPQEQRYRWRVIGRVTDVPLREVRQGFIRYLMEISL